MINNKIGRNDPCWCGSQVKYKRCHLNREKQKPLDRWEASKEFNDKFSKRMCSSPDSFHQNCSKKTIKAHTVPKSSSLKAIAKDGHVLGLKMNLESIFKNKGRPRLEKIGINNASTFNGFCKIHDDDIFAPIEKEAFKDSAEQCFLLAYRAFAKEYYAKNSVSEIDSLRHQADKGKNIDNQMAIQMQNFMFDISTRTALLDLEHHKNFFDYTLENNDYSNTKAVVFTFDSPPPVMVSGGVNPDYDFNGNLLQDLMELELRLDSIYVTSFYDGTSGKIVLSWLEHCHETCKKLVESLFQKDPDDIVTFLVQYIAKNFENTFVSPDWWESIDGADKTNFQALFADTISTESDPSSFGLTNKLLNVKLEKNNGITFVNWKL